MITVVLRPEYNEWTGFGDARFKGTSTLRALLEAFRERQLNRLLLLFSVVIFLLVLYLQSFFFHKNVLTWFYTAIMSRPFILFW